MNFPLDRINALQFKLNNHKLISGDLIDNIYDYCKMYHTIDRLVGILAKKQSIRDVIAFPKTQKGQDLMAAAPGEATDRQLRDLHVARMIKQDK